MLDEYLALGGVELGNNARAFAYASCLSCCAGLLKCDGCAGLHDATSPWTDAVYEWQDRGTNPDSELPEGLDPNYWRVIENPPGVFTLQENTLIETAQSGEPDYGCEVIDRAPWYDSGNPFSAEFAGFYLLRVSGIEDGTQTAPVTEGIEDGGVVGAPRYTTRSVRVRTMLVGCGRGAASYGLAWLKAALGDTFCARHGTACGTSDLAFFTDCPPALDEADGNYEATTVRYRRYLHGVACTSGPVVAEEYETPSGAYVLVVDYILTAESPFVWGETIAPNSAGSSVLTAFDDIPFNLLRRPSGEQADGVPRIVATQYAFNGSVEYGVTGWGVLNSGTPAAVTSGASTDVAAVGPNSFRVRFVAAAAGAGPASLGAYYDIALGALVAGSRPSVSVWGLTSTQVGPITVTGFRAYIEWRNATPAAIGTTELGNLPLTGGNVSASNLAIPAGAVTARVIVRAELADWAAATDFRIYADAIGLTVP